MSAEKRWRLVCYDVRDEKRYRKLFKIVKGAGEAVQYSIFRCRLDDLETERLRWRLSKVMAPEDSLLIIDLCPSCAHRVVARNHVEGWSEAPAAFRIIGGCKHEKDAKPPRERPGKDQGSLSGAEEASSIRAEGLAAPSESSDSTRKGS